MGEENCELWTHVVLENGTTGHIIESRTKISSLVLHHSGKAMQEWLRGAAVC